MDAFDRLLQSRRLIFSLGLLVNLTVVSSVFQLPRRDLNLLIVDSGDALQHAVWIRNYIETGWFDFNDRFGAPGNQDLRGFPQADAFHYLLMKPLIAIYPNPSWVWNWYYLLSFPFVALSSIWALNRLGFSPWVSILIANLYCFIPFHFQRAEHLFLASYFWVPVSCYFAISLMETRGEAESRGKQIAGWVCKLFVLFLIGMSGIYYAVFSCFFYLVSGFAGSLIHGSTARFLRSIVYIGVTGLGVIVALWPAIEHKVHADYNADAVIRSAAQTEIFGLKISQLLLPVHDHRIYFLRHLRQHYDLPSTPLGNENRTATLGVVASLGFLFALIRFLFQFTRPRNLSRIEFLGFLIVVTLLLAGIGGFSSMISFMISPWIRCYNRLSIFIAFFSLVAFAMIVEVVRSRLLASKEQRIGFILGCVLTLFVGLEDMIGLKTAPSRRDTERRIKNDQGFVQEIERLVEPGKMIYMLPYRSYPEAGAEKIPVTFTHSDLQRPLLQSENLRWTFGGIRGEYGDRWVKHHEALPLQQKIQKLIEAEFGGIYVDRSAYLDHGEELEAGIAKKMGPPTVVSDDQRFSFFDLAPLIMQQREKFGAVAWQQLHDRARHPVLMRPDKGFFAEEVDGEGRTYRFSNQFSAIELENSLPINRKVRIRASFELISQPEPATLKVDSSLLQMALTLQIEKKVPTETTIDLPPGVHRFVFSSDARAFPTGRDEFRRPIAYRMYQFQLEELD
jgi:phosphoglycerol transferase